MAERQSTGLYYVGKEIQKGDTKRNYKQLSGYTTNSIQTTNPQEKAPKKGPMHT